MLVYSISDSSSTKFLVKWLSKDDLSSFYGMVKYVS